jgi:Prophage antirepressor
VKRGQVYYADLRPVVGSEQGGIRPCLIIQNDTGNLHSQTVIIATMTTQSKNNLPTHVAVSSEDYCLDINTTILLEQLRTIDKGRLLSFVGRLSDSTMQKVDEALHISLALNKERKEEAKLNEVKLFQNEEFGQVRTVDIDGKTYFVGKDVANALGYSNPRDAISRHCKGVVKHDSFKEGGQEVALLPEGDIYRLIIKSQLPSADKFERWIFDEVIPQIRQTGGYQKKLSPQEMMRIQLGMIDEDRKCLKDHESRLENLENTTTIDHGQQRVLENTVNKTVISVLGGKESNAYKEIGRKVFAECNRDLKNYFKVNSRDDVPKLHYEDALKYAENWKPCTNTEMLISDCNAQMSI